MLTTSRPTLGRATLDSILPQVVAEAQLLTTPNADPATGLDFPPDSTHPVVRFKSGSCALFHTERRLWVELFDAGGSDFKVRAAVNMDRACPSGPLAAMQQFGRLLEGSGAGSVNGSGGSGDLSAATPAQRRALREFLDSQIHAAELFGSAAEFKFWLLRWFRQLIEDGKLRNSGLLLSKSS